MRLTILGPNIGTGGEFHVHQEGCRDLKGRKYAAAIHAGEVDSGEYLDARAVVLNVYPPNEFNYDADAEWRDYADTVQFFPCTDDLPLSHECAMPQCTNAAEVALQFLDAPDGQIDEFCPGCAAEAKLSGLYDEVKA